MIRGRGGAGVMSMVGAGAALGRILVVGQGGLPRLSSSSRRRECSSHSSVAAAAAAAVAGGAPTARDRLLLVPRRLGGVRGSARCSCHPAAHALCISSKGVPQPVCHKSSRSMCLQCPAQYLKLLLHQVYKESKRLESN